MGVRYHALVLWGQPLNGDLVRFQAKLWGARLWGARLWGARFLDGFGWFAGCVWMCMDVYGWVWMCMDVYGWVWMVCWMGMDVDVDGFGWFAGCVWMWMWMVWMGLDGLVWLGMVGMGMEIFKRYNNMIKIIGYCIYNSDI